MNNNDNIIKRTNKTSVLTFVVIASLTIALISMPSISNNVYAKSKSKESCGGGLTVKLNLKYLHKDPKLYKKVVLRIGDAYKKVHNWKDMPDSITVKHLDIKSGKKFEVHVDNYGTDDGEQIKMKNSPGCGQEKSSIKVP